MSVVERERAVDLKRERRASVLEAAALRIEVFGWTRDYLRSPKGAFCIMGAVAFENGCDLALGQQIWDTPDFFLDVFGGSGAGDWNDKSASSAEEVAFVLRWRAAEIRDGL